MPNHRLVYGTDRPPTEPIELQAGPVRLSFHPDSGWIRRLSIGNDEILRAIYVAVRDDQWNTIEPELTNLVIQRTSSSFRVSFGARHGSYVWQGRIVGTSEGSITYSMEGDALASFSTNRTGFCVLHPIDGCKGKACTVLHTNGSEEHLRFPETISPHQPFMDVRAITHTSITGALVRVEMSGDTFETEDQRNWTDASYKTYCRPLALPKPYTVQRGTKLRQSIHITIENASDPLTALPIRCTVSPDASDLVPLPTLGSVLASEEIDDRRAELIERLGLSIWRMPVPVEDLNVTLLQWEGGVITDLVLCPPEDRDKANVVIDQFGPVRVHVGSESNFTELNRCRPATDETEGISFAMNPQVHATDTWSIFENLVGQRECVETAQTFCLGDIHAGPIGFGGDDDPRFQSLVGAAWTLGSIKHLAEIRAVSATYFSDRELIRPDGVAPAFHILADLAELQVGEVLPSSSTNPDRCLSLYVVADDLLTVWVANLCPKPVDVDIEGLPSHMGLRRLNEDTVAFAIQNPNEYRDANEEAVSAASGRIALSLSPYEVVRLQQTELENN